MCSRGPWGPRVPRQSQGGFQNLFGPLFLDGVNFTNEKVTRQIGSLSGTPASSRGPLVSKRARLLCTSPPCSSGQFALDLGCHLAPRTTWYSKEPVCSLCRAPACSRVFWILVYSPIYPHGLHGLQMDSVSP